MSFCNIYSIVQYSSFAIKSLSCCITPITNYRLPITSFLLLIAYCLLPTELHALDPNKKMTQYVHNAWQIEDGLPQNFIQSVIQTHDGYIWVGTLEGVARFDGVKFTVFDRRTVKQIKSNRIFALFEGCDGSLWIGTDGGGLNRLREEEFSLYTIDDGLPSNNIRSIFQDHKWNLWIGTDGGGLCKFKDDKFVTYTTKDGLLSNRIYSIYEDHEGGIWIGTDKGLNRFENDTLEAYNSKDGFTDSTLVITSIYESDDGSIWIGTSENGLYRLKGGLFTNYTTKDGLSTNNVQVIYQDRAGNIWIGTGEGLNRFEEGKFSTYTTNNGLTNDFVLSICEDREENLWLGTEGGGLNRLKDGKFTTYTTSEGLINNVVWAICEGSDNDLWIGTRDGGLSRFKDGKFVNYKVLGGTILSICKSADNGIWIGNVSGGLQKFKDGNFISYNTEDGLSNNFVLSIYEDKDGVVWIGTREGNLNKFKDGKFTIYTKDDGLPGNTIRVISSSKDGSLWMGTQGGGLVHFKDGKFVLYTTKDGLSNDIIWAIYEDSEGTLWIGTDDGLTRFKNGRFRIYTTKDGLSSNIIFQILEDNEENLWFSSNNGISRISKKELNDFADDRISFVNSFLFGRADGMKSIECNGGAQPAGCKTKDGKLCFPTVKGITMIDLKKIKLGKYPLPVKIEKVIIDGKDVKQPSLKGAENTETQRNGRLSDQTIKISDSLKLPPGKKKFEFYYTALNFSAPQRVKFKYKLEGFDEEWVKADNIRIAYYTNIPPGKYTFKVIACNEDGIWNQTGAKFTFYLRPHFYQTYPFYILCGVAVIVLGIFIYQIRIIQLKNREKKLILLVEERTKDLMVEKEKSERLLLNILPEPIADRLKKGYNIIADSYPEVTVLFADIVDFTKFSSNKSPEETVIFLNEVFSKFDELAERHGLEKIKTIGDAYMVVGGLPTPRPDHAFAVAEMAIDIQMYLSNLQINKNGNIKVRIGINTGPVVAGVIGTKKFIYDLWGDTVNIASRMEAYSLPGKIQVTENTYKKLSNNYIFEKRGLINVKGKGQMETYLLIGRI